ncbi:hypothetical protein BSM4216_2534 [Bacillus smithii]|nr:hypothetical protein BSM4216_2534 [Bacillus smithii]
MVEHKISPIVCRKKRLVQEKGIFGLFAANSLFPSSLFHDVRLK